MKVIFISLMLFIISYAQLGIKAGINSTSTSITGTSLSNTDGSSDFMLGGTYDVDLVLMEIGLEANYVRFKTGSTSGSELQIPASLKFSLIPLIYLRGGALYSLNLSGGDGFENYFGFLIGLGFSFDLPVLPGFNVEGRYIIPSGDTFNVTSFSLKASQLQLTLGINI